MKNAGQTSGEEQHTEDWGQDSDEEGRGEVEKIALTAAKQEQNFIWGRKTASNTKDVFGKHLML